MHTSSWIIENFEKIARISKNLKSSGNKIVFTNGCFDILHYGHVKLLEQAKQFGDILIVGLNSDQSIKRIKGGNRPIYSHNDRAYILASMKVVDYVVVFEEDTPFELIKNIQPHVLVKGGDYKKNEIIGREEACIVEIVELIEGKSTSNIIEKIKAL